MAEISLLLVKSLSVVCRTTDIDTTLQTNDALDAIDVMNTVNAIMVSYSRYEYLQVGSHSSVCSGGGWG